MFRESKRFEYYQLQNVNKILDKCESCEYIKLQNVSENILDRCQSCQNRTKEHVDKNIITKG